jgi:hypothetical protein
VSKLVAPVCIDQKTQAQVPVQSFMVVPRMP